MDESTLKIIDTEKLSNTSSKGKTHHESQIIIVFCCQ